MSTGAKKIDAFNITGQYDIIMKSALGGLYGACQSDMGEVNDFMTKIKKENLEPNGIFISMDNGESLFEVILNYFGARKNSWRLFKPSDFIGFEEQTLFGLLSCFSFETRLCKLGQAMDLLTFQLDKTLLQKLFRSSTVICTIHKS